MQTLPYLDGMPVHCRVTHNIKCTTTHLYTWVVSCQQKHKELGGNEKSLVALATPAVAKPSSAQSPEKDQLKLY